MLTPVLDHHPPVAAVAERLSRMLVARTGAFGLAAIRVAGFRPPGALKTREAFAAHAADELRVEHAANEHVAVVVDPPAQGRPVAQQRRGVDELVHSAHCCRPALVVATAVVTHVTAASTARAGVAWHS